MSSPVLAFPCLVSPLAPFRSFSPSSLPDRVWGLWEDRCLSEDLEQKEKEMMEEEESEESEE